MEIMVRSDGEVPMTCPLCGHHATCEERRPAWIDASCARCGRLVARIPALLGGR
jgi:DNA-directed RNA polymerase subunit RPC12/RpoP